LGLLDQSAYVSFLQCFFADFPELYKDFFAISNQPGFTYESNLSLRDSVADSSDTESSLDGDGNSYVKETGSSSASLDRNDHSSNIDVSKSVGSGDGNEVDGNFGGVDGNHATYSRAKKQKTSKIGVSAEELQNMRHDVHVFLQRIQTVMGPVKYESILDDFVELRSFHRLGHTHYYAQVLYACFSLPSGGQYIYETHIYFSETIEYPAFDYGRY
jgi:hypothetical protein